jgi:NADPH:quinone reductase-like Zn-dependent oxidoreductase
MHMVHRGGLCGVVDRTFEVAEAAKAHEVIAGGDFFGKLVLRVS